MARILVILWKTPTSLGRPANPPNSSPKWNLSFLIASLSVAAILLKPVVYELKRQTFTLLSVVPRKQSRTIHTLYTAPDTGAFAVNITFSLLPTLDKHRYPSRTLADPPVLSSSTFDIPPTPEKTVRPPKPRVLLITTELILSLLKATRLLPSSLLDKDPSRLLSPPPRSLTRPIA